jgi:glutathione synthase/RimK-type ligase-like ATP-grasp enzyme
VVRKTGIFFRAVPDDGRVDVQITPTNGLNLGFPNCFIPSPRLEKMISEATNPFWFPVHPKAQVQLPANGWVVNFCADADEYSRAMTFLKGILDKTGMPTFNHPDGIMNSRRDNISGLLQGIDGLTAPKCVRFSPKEPTDFQKTFDDNGFDYPVLVRPTASQTGTHLVKVQSADDWHKVHSIPWGGQTLYMTQFVDFKNADGENIKLRVVCVGDRIFIRHILFADDWLVHARVRTGVIVDRELALHSKLLKDQKFLSIVNEIKKRVGLDFFGVDLGWISDDHFVLFEANAAMSILSTGNMPTYRREEYLQINKNIEEAVVATLRAVQFKAGKRTVG